MRIRRKTELLRATVDKQLKQLLGPETDAPAGSYRRVTLIVPASPSFAFTIDHPTPLEAGLSRPYLAARIDGGRYPFVLLPEQSLYGQVAADGGQGFATILVEYLAGQEG